MIWLLIVMVQGWWLMVNRLFLMNFTWSWRDMFCHDIWRMRRWSMIRKLMNIYLICFNCWIRISLWEYRSSIKLNLENSWLYWVINCHCSICRSLRNVGRVVDKKGLWLLLKLLIILLIRFSSLLLFTYILSWKPSG